MYHHSALNVLVKCVLLDPKGEDQYLYIVCDVNIFL